MLSEVSQIIIIRFMNQILRARKIQLQHCQRRYAIDKGQFLNATILENILNSTEFSC